MVHPDQFYQKKQFGCENIGPGLESSLMLVESCGILVAILQRVYLRFCCQTQGPQRLAAAIYLVLLDSWAF